MLYVVRDEGSLRDAIRAATASAGGWWNPIVQLASAPSPSDARIRRFARLYDPDYLVSKDRNEVAESVAPASMRAEFEELLELGSTMPRVQKGLDASLSYQLLSERQGSRPGEHLMPGDVADEEPIELFDLRFGRFGSTPAMRSLAMRYQRYFHPMVVRRDEASPVDYWETRRTPIGVAANTGLHLLTLASRAKALFFFDDSRTQSLVWYWNLRAYGYDILPVPHKWRQEFIEFAKSQAWVGPADGGYDPGIAVIGDGSADISELLEGVKGISERRVYDGSSWCNAFDPASDLEAMPDSLEPRVRIIFRGGEHATVSSDGRHHNAVVPRSDLAALGRSHHAYALVLERVSSLDDWEVAHLLPPDLKPHVVGHLLGRLGFDECRISQIGPVLVQGRFDRTIKLAFPTHEAVITRWFAEQGIGLKQSPSGRIAHRLLQTLGGVYGVDCLAFPSVLQKLNLLAHGLYEIQDALQDQRPPDRARTISVAELRGELRRIHDENPNWWGRTREEKADAHLASLIEKGVFRLGLRMQCSICLQDSWYPLENLAPTLRCDRCLRDWDFPLQKPPGSQAWHYRTQGVFSVGEFSQGAYCVVLLLAFLARSEHCRVVWMAGLELELGRRIEVDLVCWATKSYESQAQLFFAECKTFKRFSQKDIESARVAMTRFPSAIFVFATLNSELADEERALLNGLCDEFEKGKSVTRVLVLTGPDLFSSESLGSGWAESPDLAHRNAAALMSGPSFEGECDGTQEVYLGRPPRWNRKG